MARTFVYSDNLAGRVEVGQEPTADGEYWALCVGHATLTSLVDDSHEMWSFEDTVQVAELHAESCRKCADDACIMARPHDAGHRCRKP
jgi:hypothetical protein